MNNSGFSVQLHGLDETRKWLITTNRHARFACVAAINRTLKRIREAEQQEIKKVFDRPTPQTVRGMFVERATQAKQYGAVRLKDGFGKGTPPSEYLLPHIVGGERGLKRIENRLRNWHGGNMMRADEYVVPAKGLRLNRYGNVSQGTIAKILSHLRAFRESGFTANRRIDQASSYFIPKPGSNLPRGVYQRVGGRKIVPVLMFVKKPMYKKRFNFYHIAQRVVDQNLLKEWDRTFMQAMSNRGFKGKWRNP